MSMLGFSLNGVTLLSLSLVVGILVDDAIVEIENIMRHLGMGKTPFQAAMEAADEIGLAVIATTFTLIAVFLPTAFMGGVPGKFFVQFGWTAAIAVLHLAGRRPHADADDVGVRAQAAEEAAPRRPLDHDLHALGRVVPAPSHPDHARRGRVPGRLAVAGAAAADRFHPGRRPVADAGLPRARTRLDVRTDPGDLRRRRASWSRRTRT
jgi:hypothetical protein